MIGIVISTIMMAAMFTTYTVVNNSYSQVSDVASISRSGRDVVSMMMRDVRMAGFKYYYGVFEGSQEDIPAQDFLEYKTGDTEDTKYESHAPIIIYKDTLNYKIKATQDYPKVLLLIKNFQVKMQKIQNHLVCVVIEFILCMEILMQTQINNIKNIEFLILHYQWKKCQR